MPRDVPTIFHTLVIENQVASCLPQVRAWGSDLFDCVAPCQSHKRSMYDVFDIFAADPCGDETHQAGPLAPVDLVKQVNVAGHPIMIRWQRIVIAERQSFRVQRRAHRSQPAKQKLVSCAKTGLLILRGGRRESRVLRTRKRTCADAFSRKRPGHARRPPGRAEKLVWSSLARFSRLGTDM
jgi:hypothetical protein